ncbi:DNA repair protein RAD51 homolog 4-like [Physella acuta]|uniref:DNA repair protein RAD51 homolog 4-like n=1 Tax=Physella acuta TaxID=109671 RepID=UPI0027DAE34D|nr:DNA repair protein RAD51 homolog 4-like [Physella acuta]XP_059144600.1 DNA repair protein RAD51 homolog 4-like [Physella acuta]
MALRVGLCTSLNQENLGKLKAGGIRTVTDFITRDPDAISKDLHIPYKDVCSIRRVLISENSAYPVSAVTLYKDALPMLTMLSTGCNRLDELLDGGLFTAEVTEIAGFTAAGKTRICLWCAATTVMTEKYTVVYIDTCSSFSIECVLDVLSQSADFNQAELSQELLEEKLQRIKLVQAFNVFDLFSVLESIREDLTKPTPMEYGNVKLVIIDNLASPINPIIGGQIAHSQGIISQLGLSLKQLAHKSSLAVLVTNNLTTSMNGDKSKPALGKSWSHVPHTRLIIQKCKHVSSHSSLREVCLVKSGRQQTPATTTISLDRRQQDPG